MIFLDQLVLAVSIFSRAECYFLVALSHLPQISFWPAKADAEPLQVLIFPEVG